MYKTRSERIAEQKRKNRNRKIMCWILGILAVLGFFAILKLKDERDYYRAELYAKNNSCVWSWDSLGNYKVCK